MRARGTRCCAALLLGAAVAVAPPLMAQQTPGTARVSLANSIVLTRQSDLAFGDITPGTAGGTVTIQAQTGVRTTAGGVVAAGGLFNRAQFTGVGSRGRVVTFSIAPSPNLTLTRVGGGATMSVNQIRASINGGTQGPLAPNFTLPANGMVVVRIGGRLNVGANQMQGVYLGSFTFTMNYQ